MSGIKQMIDDLNEDYRTISENKMKELCEVAGVKYHSIITAPALVRALGKNGYTIRVAQYKIPDEKVGQFLVLRHLDNQVFITGFNVWIDFSDYSVNTIPVLREEDLQVGKAVH